MARDHTVIPDHTWGMATNAAWLALAEVQRSWTIHGKPMQSAHEGIAIIREEYLELEEAVFWKEREGDTARREAMREEAIQLAAMALRFIVDMDLLSLEDKTDG